MKRNIKLNAPISICFNKMIPKVRRKLNDGFMEEIKCDKNSELETISYVSRFAVSLVDFCPAFANPLHLKSLIT